MFIIFYPYSRFIPVALKNCREKQRFPGKIHPSIENQIPVIVKLRFAVEMRLAMSPVVSKITEAGNCFINPCIHGRLYRTS
jgi:hypothetical protein